jgi:hypothetical protein
MGLDMTHLKAGLLLAVITAVPAFAQPQSPSYVVHPSAAASGGGLSNSSSFRLDAAAAQPVTVGVSSSPRFVVQSGVFSFLGSGLAPVILSVDHTTGMAGQVDLAWTGSNPPYSIYESTDCANVYGATPASTTLNEQPGILPTAGSLVCYSVLATAPGP